MPYPGIEKGSPEEADMESCVADLVSQGKTKDQAIAICHAAIAGDSGMAVVRAGLELKEVNPADYANIKIVAENVKDGRLLAFTNAALAHAKINGNNDGLTSAGLKEVAATLPMTPIDIGHDNKQIMGVFTAARVRDWQRKDGVVVPAGELVTDGVIFARNYPDEAQEIVDGKRHLSIEAGADRAVFHVDAQTGAVTRYLFGLTAFGAGTTKEPADAEAVFDTENGLLIISSIRETVQATEGQTIAELEVAGKDRSDTQRMVRQAFRRSYRDAHTVVDVAEGYLVYERGGKLYQANYTIGKDGNVAFDPKHMEVTKKYTPVEQRRGMMADTGEGDVEELEKLQKELADLQAQTKADSEAKDARIAELQAEVQSLQDTATATAEQHKQDVLTASKRAMQLATIFEASEVEGMLPDLAGMDEKAFGLIVKASQKKPVQTTQQVVVADQKPDQAVGLRGLFTLKD